MSKIAVIYKSKYGSTKQYAEWIAEELEAQTFESAKVKSADLAAYDVVIYGGGLYAGTINGVKTVAEANCNKLVVFTVGLEHVTAVDCADIMAKAFAPELLPTITAFHLRGRMDYKKMGLIHKGMMAVVKYEAEKKPADKHTRFDDFVLETYGKEVDFVDRATIMPLVEFVRSL
ncbi:MAG: flavodoxin domain-containing protein [Methanosarcinales archaeon]|nr:flavodoxin domain-containing protein [Methanosarcinales archaeon]